MVFICYFYDLSNKNRSYLRHSHTRMICVYISSNIYYIYYHNIAMTCHKVPVKIGPVLILDQGKNRDNKGIRN